MFIDMCIMLGTEYAEKVPNVGPKSALAAIKKYKSIANFPISEEKKRKYAQVRKSIVNHSVNRARPKWKLPSYSKGDIDAIGAKLAQLGVKGTKYDNLLGIFAQFANL